MDAPDAPDDAAAEGPFVRLDELVGRLSDAESGELVFYKYLHHPDDQQLLDTLAEWSVHMTREGSSTTPTSP